MVLAEITALAETFGVVQLVLVFASPGKLGPAASVVTIYTHIFCIVFFVDMRALEDLPLLTRFPVYLGALNFDLVVGLGVSGLRGYLSGFFSSGSRHLFLRKKLLL